jgi:ABC-2 type transport system ATP-binding protein
MNLAILSLRNLSKYFGKTIALEDINLEIKEGETFGLLGPNGAGKTTLIRTQLTLAKPTQGEIFFRDKPLESSSIIKHFGFLPENFQPYGNLCGGEFLKIMAKGLERRASGIDSLLKTVGLLEQKDKLIRAYSRGMIQRLGLAMSLLKDPEVIILDEPTLGLDPIGQAEILNLLINLNKEGKTIFFSSHILSQIERVASRIAIIHKGRLRFTGSIKEFAEKHHCLTLEEAFLTEVRNSNKRICAVYLPLPYLILNKE